MQGSNVDRRSVEKLVGYLVIALVVQGLYRLYVWNLAGSMSPGDFSPGGDGFELADRLSFLSNLGVLISVSTNIAIALWLWIQAETKGFRWALLGLFANWWALPIYGYYRFIR